MTIRTRKLFGTIALLVLLAFWVLLGMAAYWIILGMAEAGMSSFGLTTLGQAVFYVFFGLGWVLPAMPIVSWMLRRDPG